MRTGMVLGAVLLAVVPCFASDGWKAGVATSVITPREPMWMSGYASRNQEALGKLTELWAKALVLEDAQGRQGVIVSLDLVGIDRETSLQIRRQLMEKHNLQIADVVLCTSHTHSGPVVGSNLKAMYGFDQEQWQEVVSYTRQLQRDVVRTVAAAFEVLEPAQLTYGVGRSTFAVNRRENREPDVPQLRAEQKLKGPVDHEVPVLCVSSDGRLRALLFGYACHATTLSGYEWCGDWPGYAQIELEQKHPGTTAMFFAGCGADQNPLPRRTVELAQEYGARLAAAVDEVLEEDMRPVTPTLQTSYTEIQLAFGDVPDEVGLQKLLASGNIYEVRLAEHLIDKFGRADQIPQKYPYPIQTWRLGDFTGVFLGGEVVVDYSLAIKSLSPPVDFVGGYCNDVMAYIPSERVLAEGGYEGGRSMIYYGLPSAWESGLEQQILDTVSSQLKSLSP